VLKPLYGDEPHLFENLCSFCDQQYPEYQVIFGAADPNDPALQVARRVARRFPGCAIEIVAGNAKSAGNPKIGNLLGMIDRARNPIVVIADSDIHVGPDYLHAVASCFTDARTGAATCIYGGVPDLAAAAQLGATHVNDHFAPSVMVAAALEPLTYCFGATMAVRRDVLDEIGGLERIADHLGDDYLLGNLTAEAGYRVALVPYAVQTTVSDRSFVTLYRRELRWARTILGQRPGGYAGMIVMYVLPFAIAYAAFARTPLSAISLALAGALRVALHYEGLRAFAPQARPTPWLVPLRDALGLVVWASGFFGKRVRWKDDKYRLHAGGRMAVGPEEM
jgi:ceramide glucosyltransferase